jgi:hypothetical protein
MVLWSSSTDTKDHGTTECCAPGPEFQVAEISNYTSSQFVLAPNSFLFPASPSVCGIAQGLNVAGMPLRSVCPAEAEAEAW